MQNQLNVHRMQVHRCETARVLKLKGLNTNVAGNSFMTSTNTSKPAVKYTASN